MLRRAGGRRHHQSGGGHSRPQPAGGRPGLCAAACGRRTGASAGSGRPTGGSVAGAEHRVFQPHGAQNTLGAPEGGGVFGRPHGPAQRHQPVDHRRASPCRWACLARQGLHITYRHRHSAARSAASGCTPGRNITPAPPGGGRQPAANPAQRATLHKRACGVHLRCGSKRKPKKRPRGSRCHRGLYASTACQR